MEARPFVVTTSVSCKGGLTDRRIDLDTELVDNRMFFSINAFKDFKLLAAFGLAKPVKSDAGKIEKYEYNKCKVFDYIKQIRFKRVTSLLTEAIAADDPFAEEQPAAQALNEITKRQALFLKYEITPVCVATCKEFTLRGETIPPFQMTMLTAATKSSLLKLECTASVLDWLCKACQADPNIWCEDAPHADEVARKRTFEELPVLPSHIRYKHNKKNKVMMFARFKSSEGKWNKHEKVIEDQLEQFGGDEEADARCIAVLCETFDREVQEKKKDKSNGSPNKGWGSIFPTMKNDDE